MKQAAQAVIFVLALVTLQDAFSQRMGGGDGPVRRNQSGGINYAPLPGIFVVVSVDSYSGTVRLRAADGATADVQVGEDIYDVSRLKAGDRIQVDFLETDDPNKLKAATVWPVR